ncbi:MAG: eukaryotic-like serine/threonine-protein kinase [Gemmatimonadaceae bacterium]|nr:eukaryotic-like serine/threonine-protein kinase [Gemmatimonadaceae bacterium]
MTDPIGPIRAALAGRYEIEREIGQGAFATVYLARDLRHDRLVAFKVLKADPTSEDGELRFLREIRLLAKLQHPNIIPLIDSGHAEALLFYVMPYVTGESLRERIRRERQLPIDAAIAIAREAADALGYAHDQGIIHRDIKPENILLSAGRPMIADFGVARAIDLAGMRQLTRGGVGTPGTPAYMSPEQLLGTAPVDQRSDIYSLGCVLYETLTGKPPFAGVDDFSKRFTEPPPRPSALRADLPPSLDLIVTKAIALDPKDRYPNARDFERALAEGVNNPSLSAASAQPAKGNGERSHQRGIVGVVVVLALLMSGAAAWGWMRRAPAEQVVRYALVVDSSEAMVRSSSSWGRLDISPDGSRLAYIGGPTGQLLIRPRNELRAIAIPGTDGANTPFFSPDGRQVGFVSGGKLQIVPVNGGAPVVVTDSLVEVAGASWGPDGFIYADGLGRGSLVRVEAKPGAIPKPFTTLDTASGEIDHRWPEVLPNGKGVLFTVMFSGKNAPGKSRFAVAVADIPSGNHRVIVDDAVYGRYAMAGDLLYVTTKRILMVVGFDQNSMAVTGGPTTLIEDMRTGSLGSPDLAISDQGTLVYATSAGEGRQELVWVSRDGKARSVDPDWQGGSFSDPAISPDGKRVAVARGTGGETGDIWVKQLDAGPGNKLTQEGTSNASPTWTPDGRSVTFSSNVAGSFDLWTGRSDGSAQPVPQFHEQGNLFGSRWSRDGKWLVFQTSEWSSPGSGDIGGIRPGIDTIPIPLVATRFREISPALSPDGHWLAYASNESDEYDIYVVPFPNTAAAKWVVSTHGGTEPQWSHSGSELFYRDAAGNLVAVVVRTRPTFSVGRSATLFPAAGFASFEFSPQYDISLDDQRFLMIRPLAASGPDRLIVVENWFEELKAKSRQ